MQHDLDRLHSNSTRPCVHEDALALAQSRDVLQCMPRGNENDRQGRSRLKCQAFWNRSHIARARYRVSGNSEDGETEHTISWSDVRNVRANCFDDAAHFVAKNVRIRSIAWIKCQRLEHVTEIHSRCFDFN